jgi:hypothetical protein
MYDSTGGMSNVLGTTTCYTSRCVTVVAWQICCNLLYDQHVLAAQSAYCHACFMRNIDTIYVQSAGPALDTAVSLVTGIRGPLRHNGAMYGTTISNTDATSTDATTTAITGVTYSGNIDDTSPEYIREELGFSSKGTKSIIAVTFLFMCAQL